MQRMSVLSAWIRLTHAAALCGYHRGAAGTQDGNFSDLIGKRSWGILTGAPWPMRRPALGREQSASFFSHRHRVWARWQLVHSRIWPGTVSYTDAPTGLDQCLHCPAQHSISERFGRRGPAGACQEGEATLLASLLGGPAGQTPLQRCDGRAKRKWCQGHPVENGRRNDLGGGRRRRAAFSDVARPKRTRSVQVFNASGQWQRTIGLGAIPNSQMASAGQAGPICSVCLKLLRALLACGSSSSSSSSIDAVL